MAEFEMETNARMHNDIGEGHAIYCMKVALDIWAHTPVDLANLSGFSGSQVNGYDNTVFYIYIEHIEVETTWLDI